MIRYGRAHVNQGLQGAVAAKRQNLPPDWVDFTDVRVAIFIIKLKKAFFSS
jgi:hypothetical protein